MTVTEVNIRLAVPDPANPRLLAYVSIVLDGLLVVRDLRVIRGNRRVFVAMPDRAWRYRTLPDEFQVVRRPVVEPTGPEAREMIEDAVLGAFLGGAGRPPAVREVAS